MTLPVVVLTAAHAAAVEAHLLRLDAGARSLRFAAGLVTDDTVRRYVAGIDPDRDVVLGAFDRNGTLVAVAHGCVYEVRGRTRIEAAFSVDAPWRGLGLATALMAELRDHAERIGAESLVAMCLARNAAMRRVFAHAGMQTEQEDGEVHARCDIGAALDCVPA